MNREELIEFLRENLSIDTRENRGYYGERSLTIQLKLGEEVISSEYVDMPRECSHRNDYY